MPNQSSHDVTTILELEHKLARAVAGDLALLKHRPEIRIRFA